MTTIRESRSHTTITYNTDHVVQISVSLEGVFLWMFHMLIDTRARLKFQALLRQNCKRLCI